MKIDNLNEIIAECIPNTLLEVEGETPLAVKLAPWIQSAKNWLESEYLGPDDFLNEGDNARAVRIVVFKAFADAIPSLDLVVTPTGFGVVSTDSVAPASKDRINRLLESIRSQIDGELDLLLEFCHQYPEWRASERGKYFCATFLSSLRDNRKIVFESYDDMRNEAMHVESLMEERYLGHNLMTRLRNEYNSRKPYVYHDLANPVRSAVLNIVYPINNKSLENNLWHSCRPIIEMLHRFPEYYDIWKAEMGERFNQQPFINNIKGSYYF